jgi:hypothetical protein
LLLQTLADPRQIRRPDQIRPDFFSHCLNGTTVYNGTIHGTQIPMQQVRNYGLWIDGDILSLWRPNGDTLSVQMLTPISGMILLSYAKDTPQIYLLGIGYADVRIVAQSGNWVLAGEVATGSAQPPPVYGGRPALATVKVENGRFVSIQSIPAKSACDSFLDTL